jgi:S-DNA-T family DNA segregation ATPase FtsK/SpoIIIE
MANQNRIKDNFSLSDTKSGSKKKTRKKKSTGKKKDYSKAEKGIGLIFILFSIYLFIALISYFFTGKADYDTINDYGFKIIFDTNVYVENWLGRIGAWIAQVLAYNSFGIASLLIVPWLFVIGIRLLFNTTLTPIKKLTKQVILGLIFISVFLAFFLDNYPEFGGAFGFYISHWLVGLIGNIGTVILLIFSLVGYLIYQFNIDPSSIAKKISYSFKAAKPKQSNDVDEDNIYIKDKPDTVELDNVYVHADELAPIVETESTQVEEDEMTLEINGISENKESTIAADTVEQNDKKDDEFTVEMAKEKDVFLTDSEIKNKAKELVDEVGEYDPRLELHNYQFPTIDLLKDYTNENIVLSAEELKEELNRNKDKIVNTLGNYKISIAKIKATIGPTVTLYEIVPAAGVRISKIKNLEDDIALSLAALGIRIIAPIPGKGTVGIEVPNSKPSIVAMRSLIASEKFQNSKMELPIALGKTISNETFIADLAKMPHLLMAGATGQGKSVGLNAILVSLIYKKHPSEIKFVLVDPKKVELTLFNKIERHFLAKLPDGEDAIITDTKTVINTLNSLTIEMDLRYDLLKDAQVRNIKEYNQKFIRRRLNPENGHRFLPYIILIIDEFADLIMTAGKEIEGPIARLAQLARAIGIHLVIATQRPSVNIITGSIKANFPARIAFRVMSKIDSRTILDTGGADQLIGRGDLLLTTGQEVVRLQCGFVDTPEVDEITTFIGSQKAYPEALILPEYVGEEAGKQSDFDADDRDVKFEEAARIVVLHQQGSASLLQRKLKLGYNRAGRIVDQLEAAGIIGPFEGSKARQVLIPDEISLEQLLTSLI